EARGFALTLRSPEGPGTMNRYRVDLTDVHTDTASCERRLARLLKSAERAHGFRAGPAHLIGDQPPLPALELAARLVEVKNEEALGALTQRWVLWLVLPGQPRQFLDETFDERAAREGLFKAHVFQIARLLEQGGHYQALGLLEMKT